MFRSIENRTQRANSNSNQRNYRTQNYAKVLKAMRTASEAIPDIVTDRRNTEMSSGIVKLIRKRWDAV